MIESMRIIGAGGRVGSAVSARLAERGVLLDADDPELVLLCVPDRVIAEVAGELQLGPWIAHVSGATPSRPSTRTSDGSDCTPCSRSPGPRSRAARRRVGRGHRGDREARTVGFWLGDVLGLRPFELDDANRAAYHAGAAFASNYLVTLRAAAGSLLEAAGAPPGARSAHPRRHRRRLRAHWPDRARGLGDRGATPGRDPRGTPGARRALPRARRGDRVRRRSRHYQVARCSRRESL